MANVPSPEDEDDIYAFQRAVGQRVTAMREKSGISRRQMTERAGLKHAYGYLIEDGGQNFTIKTLLVIARVLGCTPRDLMPDPPEETDVDSELRLLRQRVKNHLEIAKALDDSLGQLRESIKSTKRFGED